MLMLNKAGLGLSKKSSSSDAANEAYKNALKMLGDKTPNFIFCFFTEKYSADILLEKINSLDSDIPVFPLCAPAVISSNCSFENGVVILALSSKDITILKNKTSYNLDDFKKTSQTISKVIIKNIRTGYQNDFRDNNLFFLGIQREEDGYLKDIVMQNIGDELGAFCHLLGGGSSVLQQSTGMNSKDENTDTDSFLLQTTGKVSIGIGHGFKPYGRSMIVTKVKENIIYELDGQAARSIYLKYFPDHKKQITENFAKFLIKHPFGFTQMNDEYIIRDPYDFTDDGGLVCAGLIPQYSVIQIMNSNEESLLQAIEKICKSAISGLNGRRPVFALVISCISRLNFLNKNCNKEWSIIKKVLGPEIPFIGFYSYGEFGSFISQPAFYHNKTFIIAIIGEND